MSKKHSIHISKGERTQELLRLQRADRRLGSLNLKPGVHTDKRDKRKGNRSEQRKRAVYDY